MATVEAQDAGVRISPAIIEETLEPGTDKVYDLEVQNLNDFEQTFYLTVRNIKNVTDGGQPVYAESNLEPTGFELVDWVTLPVTEITLGGGESGVVTFDFSVPMNASPQSHFGSIFVSADPPEIENSGAAVGYQVGNIISIRVAGDANEDATIREFSAGRFLYGSQDVEFSVKIENKGNVLVRPVGPLEIYNSLGRKVSPDNFLFNDSGAAVFPGEIKEFTNVRWIGDGAGFGRYEAVISPVYGDLGAQKTISSTVTFWILPFNIIGPALAVLGVLLLVTIIGVRMYINRVLAQMNAGRRLVRRRQNGPSLHLLLIVSILIVMALFLLVMLVLYA